MTGYAKEFGLNWHTLLACAIGMSLGSAVSHYTMNLLGPAMLKEFGWSRADFALIGSITLLTMPLIPLAGRFTDRFGSRVAAMVGFTVVPLGFIAYTFMSGSIVQFFAIYLVQHIFGVLTTTLVFARVIVERFDAARGMALSLLMTGPPLVAAIAVPLLGRLIREHGWRSGWLTLAALSAMAGIIAITVMGRSANKARPARHEVHLGMGEFLALLRHPAFLLLVGGMILVNLPQVFVSSQMVLVVQESGVSEMLAAWMISFYSIGVIIGRFGTGLALDRVPARAVALATLAIPAIGYLVLYSTLTATCVLVGAVLIIGLAQGAEGDIGSFLVSRKFRMKNFSLLQSFVTASIGLGSAMGSLFMSFTLRRTESYDSFLMLAAVTTVIGAVLIYLAARAPTVSDGPIEPEQGVFE
ncbi:MFS transporter [Novosphingobium sp.]|uniref:MFS transporter n=1 Tax=Novosphingobium sp. TaxID=1874826 RepID=UPI00286E0482|nr:MFS transporter [Novosphingobium sp.]